MKALQFSSLAEASKKAKELAIQHKVTVAIKPVGSAWGIEIPDGAPIFGESNITSQLLKEKEILTKQIFDLKNEIKSRGKDELQLVAGLRNVNKRLVTQFKELESKVQSLEETISVAHKKNALLESELSNLHSDINANVEARLDEKIIHIRSVHHTVTAKNLELANHLNTLIEILKTKVPLKIKCKACDGAGTEFEGDDGFVTRNVCKKCFGYGFIDNPERAKISLSHLT